MTIIKACQHFHKNIIFIFIFVITYAQEVCA
jgi:hypothetical protein